MRDPLRVFRAADVFVDNTHSSVQSIMAFALLKIGRDSIYLHGNTPWQISSQMSDEARFAFLAALVWASVVHHEGDVTCVLFSRLIDELEHNNHPGLWNSSTDCIRTCDSYAIFVGRQLVPKFLPGPTVTESDGFAIFVLETVDATPGIWKLTFEDGFPVHELILHSLAHPNIGRYRIVQSNVGRYTLAQFCFHWPNSPSQNVPYNEYGLPYTSSTMSSSKEEVRRFLTHVQSASLIPEFDQVVLSRLDTRTDDSD